MLGHTPCGTDDLLGPSALLHDLLPVPGTGGFGVPTATDGLSIDAGDPVPAGCFAAPPYGPLALALSTWPAGAACLVTLHLPPAVQLCCMVPHAASAVHLAPPAWVSRSLAHAGGLQWPTPLGTAAPVANPGRVPTHPGQSPTSYSSHSKAAGLLCHLPTGTSCSLAGLTSPSAAWPPPPCYQGLGCYIGCRAPSGRPLACCPCLLATVCAAPRCRSLYSRSLH